MRWQEFKSTLLAAWLISLIVVMFWVAPTAMENSFMAGLAMEGLAIALMAVTILISVVREQHASRSDR